jgi:hypothetical protein
MPDTHSELLQKRERERERERENRAKRWGRIVREH